MTPEEWKHPVDWQDNQYELYGYVPDAGFGKGVSISKDGSTVAVGSPDFDHNDGDGNTGIVQVYEYLSEGETWSQKGEVIMPPTGSKDIKSFGYRVGLSDDGTSLAVAAPHSADPVGDSTEQVGALFIWDWNRDEKKWEIDVPVNYGTSQQKLGLRGVAVDSSNLPRLHAVDEANSYYSFEVRQLYDCVVSTHAIIKSRLLTLLLSFTNSSKVIVMTQIQFQNLIHQLNLSNLNVCAVPDTSHLMDEVA